MGQNYLLISRMSPLVILHIAFRREAQPAIESAGKRPLVPMDSDMYLKILFLTKSLATSRHSTAERLRPVMHVHVSP